MRTDLILRRALAAPLVTFALILATAGLARAEDMTAKAVLELYTSQGCVRCPPADALAAEIAKRDDVLVLSFHVDYWNYIGWRDPFSSPEATARQKRYARALGMSYVYTPQVVVDGQTAIVGSKTGEVRALVSAAAARNDKVGLKVSHPSASSLRVHLPADTKQTRDAVIWLAFYDRSHETRVGAGENAGRTIVNTNVVRMIQPVGGWNGAELSLDIDLTRYKTAGRDGCAILVQLGGDGPIIAAAAVDLPDLTAAR